MASLINRKFYRELVEEWHRNEDRAQHITGDISPLAKDRLARELELVFSHHSETKEIVKDNLEPKKRGRPPHVNR